MGEFEEASRRALDRLLDPSVPIQVRVPIWVAEQDDLKRRFPRESQARAEESRRFFEAMDAALLAVPVPLRQFLFHRFGLEGEEPLTIPEIAERFGVSPEGVSAGIDSALEILRQQGIPDPSGGHG